MCEVNVVVVVEEDGADAGVMLSCARALAVMAMKGRKDESCIFVSVE